jgi:hypothetical protein
VGLKKVVLQGDQIAGAVAECDRVANARRIENTIAVAVAEDERVVNAPAGIVDESAVPLPRMKVSFGLKVEPIVRLSALPNLNVVIWCFTLQ